MSAITLNAVSTPNSDQSQFNNIHEAISGDIVPRNASGIATDLAGALGSSSFQWSTVHVTTGHLIVGMLIPFYDFGGTLPIPQGYMLCNGLQINALNYENQHAEGDWVKYVGASQLESLYLPNLNQRYVYGVASTESGTVPLTTVGNTGSTIDLRHNHGASVNSSTVANVIASDPGGPGSFARPIGDHFHTFSIPLSFTDLNTTPVSIDFKFVLRISD